MKVNGGVHRETRLGEGKGRVGGGTQGRYPVLFCAVLKNLLTFFNSTFRIIHCAEIRQSNENELGKTRFAQAAMVVPPLQAPRIRGIWDQFSYSHSVWNLPLRHSQIVAVLYKFIGPIETNGKLNELAKCDGTVAPHLIVFFHFGCCGPKSELRLCCVRYKVIMYLGQPIQHVQGTRRKRGGAGRPGDRVLPVRDARSLNATRLHLICKVFSWMCTRKHGMGYR